MNKAYDIEEEVKCFENVWIGGAHLEVALQKSLFSTNNKMGFIICGESGVGKSAIAKFVHAKIQAHSTDERSHFPVISVSLESKSLVIDVLFNLLEQLGIEEEDLPRTGRSERKLKRLLYKQIEVCEVRVIIFDEFQHLLRRRDASVNESVCYFIKVLMTKTGVSIGLFGITAGVKLLTLDEQIKSRWSQPVILKSLALNQNGEPEYFAWFLAELLKQFPRKTKDLASKENALRFLMATNGNLRELKKILKAVLRASKPEKTITMVDVKAAYLSINHDPEFYGRNGRKIHPFTAQIERIERYLKDEACL